MDGGEDTRSSVFVRLLLMVVWLGVRVTSVLRIGFILRYVGLRDPLPGSAVWCCILRLTKLGIAMKMKIVN
jgi:hypothetical protein